MAYVAEASTWDAGVYQLEVGDYVIGGVSGTANMPSINLANRTLYLKDAVDALQSAATATDTTLASVDADVFFYSIAF